MTLFFFFFCILVDFFLPVAAGDWKTFAAVAKSRRSFTAQPSVCRFPHLDCLWFLSMEKDNNLDFFFFFHSLFPFCSCHEWSGLLNYRLPYQVRAVWRWKCCRHALLYFMPQHRNQSPHFYIITPYGCIFFKECLWLLTLLHFWKFISACQVVW